MKPMAIFDFAAVIPEANMLNKVPHFWQLRFYKLQQFWVLFSPEQKVTFMKTSQMIFSIIIFI